METTIAFEWTPVRKLTLRFVGCYVLLFMLSFTTPHEIIPDLAKFTAAFWETMIQWFAPLFGIGESYTVAILSDSTGLYVHCVLLLLYSAILVALWSFLKRKNWDYNKLLYWFLTVVAFYLAMQLFCYGFNKIFKVQFFLPEPNTLYTPLGFTPKDMLFWSTMGTSYSYSVFAGMMEVLAAFLLLFRKTRLLGALLAAGIMTNVVMINFSFDISVKVFSTFLLGLSLLITRPAWKSLYAFFILKKTAVQNRWSPRYDDAKKHRSYLFAKSIVVLLILLDALLPYLKTGNFNDDLVERPLFHGAYHVSDLNASGTQKSHYKKMFVHREGYFITQKLDDSMMDYVLTYDTVQHQLQLFNYYDSVNSVLNYKIDSAETLVIWGQIGNEEIKMRLSKIPLDQMPALAPSFHWTIDDYD